MPSSPEYCKPSSGPSEAIQGPPGSPSSSSEGPPIACTPGLMVAVYLLLRYVRSDSFLSLGPTQSSAPGLLSEDPLALTTEAQESAGARGDP